MTERPVGVTDVGSGAGVADYRTRERSVGGSTVVEQYLLYQEERVRSWVGGCTTFRMPPPASSATKPISCLFNKAGSGVLVAVRRVTLNLDYVAAFTATLRTFRTSLITTAPTTGTLHTPVGFDTAQSQNASVEFRGGASADGTASDITATAGSNAWSEEAWHNIGSAIGQQRLLDDPMAPHLMGKPAPCGAPVVLREGEGLLTVGQFGAEHHAVINCCWEEYTLP